MKTYTLLYDDTEIAILHIDEERAAASIREMVEFWAGWENRLGRAFGDYTKCWLKQLAAFTINHGRLPGVDDEGWVSLRPSPEHPAIVVAAFWPWSHESDLITVEGPVS